MAVPANITTPFAVQQTLRQRVEAEIDNLVSLLDRIDGDPDFEPWLGSIEITSFHTVENVPQDIWSGGNRDDREGTNEDGGNVLDVPHDWPDSAPDQQF